MKVKIDSRSPNDAHNKTAQTALSSVLASHAITAFLFAVSAVSLALLFLGAVSTGVSWNEPEHQEERLKNFFEFGLHVTNEQVVDGKPDLSEPVSVYGPVFDLMGHAAAVVLGSELWGAPSLSIEGIQHRHLLMALTGLLTALLVGLAVRIESGHLNATLFAIAATLSFPMWLGHSMFNPKDLPVAFGYTSVTVGLLLLYSSSTPGSGRQAKLAKMLLGILVVTAGLVVGVGTRPGMLPIYALSILVFIAILLFLPLLPQKRGEVGVPSRISLRLILGVTAPLLLAWAILWGIYPAIFSSFELVVRGVTDSGKFPWPGTVFFLGQHFSMPPPSWYVPFWFLVQVPVYLLLMATFTSLAQLALGRYLAGRPVSSAGAGRPSVMAFLLFLVQFTAVPVYAILSDSSLYGGIRHLLFIVPAFIALVTLSLYRTSLQSRASRSVNWALAVVGLVATTANNIALHPYQYVSYNAVASAVIQIDNNMPVDYWRLSGRELVSKVPTVGELRCSTLRQNVEPTLCETNRSFSPYFALRGASAVDSRAEPPKDGFWLLQYNRHSASLPNNCEEFDVITRRNFFQNVTVGVVGRCRIDSPAAGE